MLELPWWLASPIALMSLAGLALAAAGKLKLPVRQVFLPITVSVFLLLYLGALAGVLQIVSHLVLVLGLSTALGLITRAKWRRYILELPDLRLFIACLIGFWIATTIWLRDFQFIGYDEFTHWALIAKFLIDNHALPTLGSHIIFMQYAPGTALAQYFFASIAGGAEQAVIFGHLCLLFASVLFITSKTESALATIVIMVWSLLAIYVLRYDLSFIFVDAMLGVLLAAALFGVIALKTEADQKHQLIRLGLIAPMIAYLPLVKHVGLVFALAVILLFVTTSIERQRAKYGAVAIPGLKGAARASLFLLGVLAVAYLSWKLHYQSLGVTDEYKKVITFGNALNFFFQPSDPSHIAVWQTFGIRMTSSVGIVTIVLLVWSTLFIGIARPEQRPLLGTAFASITLGFAGYLALLLISYAFFFIGDERIHLASFERYARSYQLGWLLLLISLPSLKNLWVRLPGRAWIIGIMVVGLIGLAAHPLARSSLFMRAHIDSSDHQKRIALAEVAAEINQTVPPASRIYFFDSLGDGLSWYMLNYELAGLFQVETCWSAPARLADGSLGQPNAGCETDLTKILEGYDYVVLFAMDIDSRHQNSALLAGQPMTTPKLYKVNKTSSGVLSIEPPGKK